MEGIKEEECEKDIHGDERCHTTILHKTSIDKIYGNQFCYKNNSYKDLLYNGQIIKKGEKCPNKYEKNCGIIDTLEQQLCIKNGEKCPLYDIRIGPINENEHYISGIEGKRIIYYDNETYNSPNKKIIGKLILNDEEPCYKFGEKLWKKFIGEEAGQRHLIC